MLFNSFVFAIFFPIVLGLYWAFSHRLQNRMLLVASYLFYGYWDWRFLFLILLSTIVDYYAGLAIEREHGSDDPGALKRKKVWLIVSICTNLGILGFFKYFNFFFDTFAEIIPWLGTDPDSLYLKIILPVGISFYTFQTMSYTIDIYRKILRPTRSFFDFALYVAFFPQLVAGPIERAKALLPRILNKRKFDYNQFLEGIHLIFWGLFKKVYVADNLAPVVERIFSASDPSGFDVAMGAYAFAFQIYCDFSGYSDIARGCAKCLGIELMLNFNHPYISVNPSDFWRRWHISLSTWLRDYLYFPLGGNRHGESKTLRNLALTMLLGGLWHGASWVFVLWGGYQGAFLIAHRLMDPFFRRTAEIHDKIPHLVRRLFKIVIMFQLACVGWIIFRANSMNQIWDMMEALVTWRGVSDWSLLVPLVQFAGPLMVIDFIQAFLKRDDLQNINSVPLLAKTCAYGLFFYLLAFHGASAQSFIYFQF